MANLGLQQRRDPEYRLLAELVSWFDLAAIQEVNDNLAGLRGIQHHLPPSYRVLFSDAAGNQERLAFVYDSAKVTLLAKVGEVAIPPRDLPSIALPGIDQPFRGFDPTPYLAGSQAGDFTVVLVNVHLFFGSDRREDVDRRRLETDAVACWADLRHRSANAFTANIVALGDFNLPKAEAGDPVYDALTAQGLHLPRHSTVMGSSLTEDTHYDQLAFFAGPTRDAFECSGVFDFDGALFRSLWENPDRSERDFFAYLRYYTSNHRLLWSSFRI